MRVKKTSFGSYCIGKESNIAQGCKYCIKGRKLVLFITGLCSRNCFYCSLSNKRKGKDVVWANEKQCKNVKDAIEEARLSQARGAGITGGDPLLKFNRTIKYAKALKKEFDNFHIHIYLPTKLITKERLATLSRYVDEVRFHPVFLINDIETIKEELEKIKIALNFWEKENIGIELPLLPDKFIETIRIIRACSPLVGFVNLNELEISDTNFNYITKNYEVNQDGYTIKGSKELGLKILKEMDRLDQAKPKIHLCTAKTKNLYQYKNRLMLRKIMPFGFKTKEGSVRYFVIYSKKPNKLASELARLGYNEIYVDKPRNRIILSEKIVSKILNLGYKIARVEELPTADATPLLVEYL